MQKKPRYGFILPKSLSALQIKTIQDIMFKPGCCDKSHEDIFCLYMQRSTT